MISVILMMFPLNIQTLTYIIIRQRYLKQPTRLFLSRKTELS